MDSTYFKFRGGFYLTHRGIVKILEMFGALEIQDNDKLEEIIISVRWKHAEEVTVFYFKYQYLREYKKTVTVDMSFFDENANFLRKTVALRIFFTSKQVQDILISLPEYRNLSFKNLSLL